MTSLSKKKHYYFNFLTADGIIFIKNGLNVLERGENLLQNSIYFCTSLYFIGRKSGKKLATIFYTDIFTDELFLL